VEVAKSIVVIRLTYEVQEITPDTYRVFINELPVAAMGMTPNEAIGRTMQVAVEWLNGLTALGEEKGMAILTHMAIPHVKVDVETMAASSLLGPPPGVLFITTMIAFLQEKTVAEGTKDQRHRELSIEDGLRPDGE
jgi:hypothetical protein